MALPTGELLAIPGRANTIELFTDRLVLHLDIIMVNLRQQDSRCLRVANYDQ